MAVDSMQVDGKPIPLAFIGKSKNAENVPIRESSVEPSPLGNELTCHEEQQAVEKLLRARKKLEEEIEVSSKKMNPGYKPLKVIPCRSVHSFLQVN